MNNMFNQLKQLRIAFIGISDTGKSALISSLVSYLQEKIYSSVNTQMNKINHSSKKDIYENNEAKTLSRVSCSYGDYELMFIECPSYFECLDQIKDEVEMASIIIMLIDYNRQEESRDYCKEILRITNPEDKPQILFYTHAPYNYEDYFNSNLLGIELSLEYLLSNIDRVSGYNMKLGK